MERNMNQPHPQLILPARYDLIVGDTFELFFHGILNAVDYRFYDFEMTFANDENFGMCLRRKYCVTPKLTDVGDHTVTIQVRDNTGNLAAQGNTVLHVAAPPANPETEKVVLCVGDSLTCQGQWPAELHRRLTSNDTDLLCLGLKNIKFIGTSIHKGVPYVGYGGWRFDTYNNASILDEFRYINGTFDKTIHDQHALYQDENGFIWKLESITPNRLKLILQTKPGTLPSSGILRHVNGGINTSDIFYDSVEPAEGNPFWNTHTQKVDFAGYAAQKGASSIDYCHVLLGWNCSWFSEDAYKAEVRLFLNNLLSAFPKCKITLVGLQLPARDGLGYSYGVSWKYYEKLQFAWNLERWYKDICYREPAYSGKVEYIQLSGQFDTEYNMPIVRTTPNLRNPLAIEVQSNGLHPADAGYLQIADAVFRHMAASL